LIGGDHDQTVESSDDRDPVPWVARQVEVTVLARYVLLRLSNSSSLEAYLRRARMAAPLVRRFVAGETIETAVQAVQALNQRRMTATLDYLGENVTNPADANEAAGRCLQIIDAIARERLDANLSLKLTQLGLDIDTGITIDHMQRILDAADREGQFVRIDMETSGHVDRTLEVFRSLWLTRRNVGLVFQSYLHRTDADLQNAIRDGVRVRLVKGAYDEPPTIAYRRKADVDRAFARQAELLIEKGVYPAIATHDPRLLDNLKQYIRDHDVPSDRFEFQMLFGIRRDLQDRLVAEGYRMRVYTPFGNRWYGYMMRRLAERPANLWFVLKNLVRP